MTFGPSCAAPLVSVIVTNHNYGRFLREAVESVFRQSYDTLECVVVDDASTDESPAVLEALARTHTELRIVRLAENGGQSAAILAGLAATRGDYVLFLDADDILFDLCVATHVAVHMSARRAVGFTCCDALQIVGDRIVVARNANISRAFLTAPAEPRLFSASALAALAELGIDLPPVSADIVRHVPWTNVAWPWSTTSSMLFRRETLDIIKDARGLAGLRIATDNYLAHAINHLTGSLVIDAQLVGYRLHGGNGFNKRPSLDGFLCHDRADEHYEATRRILLADLLERCAHHAKTMDWPGRLLEICKRIDVTTTDGRSVFRHLVAQHRAALEELLGASLVRRWRLRLWWAEQVQRLRAWRLARI